MQDPAAQHSPEPGPGSGPLRVRGRTNGLVVYVDDVEWSLALSRLDGYLHQSAEFFQGSQLSLDVGGRLLSAQEAEEVRYLLQCHAIQLTALYSTNPQTCEIAQQMGLTAVLTPVLPENGKGRGGEEFDILSPAAPAGGDPGPGEPASQAARADAPLVHRGGLRSGQVLRNDGPILVIGDVNPGAQVISASHIFVWGRLRGIAHAGAQGDEQALVAALDFEPTQLRIADHVAISPSNQLGAVRRWFGRSQERRPEVARVADDQIVVEPWQDSNRRLLGYGEPKAS